MGRPKIGLALGSGGARGWCHIGVIEALADLGVKPDMISGTSMGAVVGAAWAGEALPALKDWVEKLTPAAFLRLMDVSFNSGGLVEARHLEALMKDIGVPARLEDLHCPFTAVATDMQTGREIWFSEGETYRAVRGSAGIPGVMTPVKYDGRWLLDGGLVNPVPVSAVRALGAEVILAVNPNARPDGQIWKAPDETPHWIAKVLPEALHDVFGISPEESLRASKPGYFDVVNAAIDVTTQQISRARLAGEPPHVLMDADLTHITVLELFRGKEIIAEGHRLVEAQADRIRRVCGLD